MQPASKQPMRIRKEKVTLEMARARVLGHNVRPQCVRPTRRSRQPRAGTCRTSTTMSALRLMLLCGSAAALQPSLPRTPRAVRCGTCVMNEADAQATMAKARRVVRKDGGGGFAATRAKKAKRSEQVKPASGKGFGKPAGLNYDRVPAATAACACDNGQTYGDCACSTLHKFMRKPESPIELVRARYTAYAYRLPDYLMRTTDPEGDEWDADVTSWKKGLLGFCVRVASSPAHAAWPRSPCKR
jgi:hypothetical protein